MKQFDLFDGPKGVPADVAKLFEEMAFSVIKAGYDRYSARSIIHRIRWHYHIDRGVRTFKCNNNWTPALARWFMAKHPTRAGFFETRESRSDK
jgi:hypothetical protein